MSIARDANQLFIAACDNPSLAAAIQSEYNDLTQKVIAGDASSDVTSSTVNGQTFAANVSMTEIERWQMLGRALTQLKAGVSVGTRTRALFGYGYR